MAHSVTGHRARPVETGDERAARALINAGRVPRLAEAAPAMLAEALAGRPRVNSRWWDELADLNRLDEALQENRWLSPSLGRQGQEPSADVAGPS